METNVKKKMQREKKKKLKIKNGGSLGKKTLDMF